MFERLMRWLLLRETEAAPSSVRPHLEQEKKAELLFLQRSQELRITQADRDELEKRRLGFRDRTAAISERLLENEQ